jgi:hypothetical protein
MAGATARIGSVLGGTWRGWIDRNLAALAQVDHLLAPGPRALFDAFTALRRDPSPRMRLAGLRRLGIHRQTAASQALMLALALAGRL